MPGLSAPIRDCAMATIVATGDTPPLPDSPGAVWSPSDKGLADDDADQGDQSPPRGPPLTEVHRFKISAAQAAALSFFDDDDVTGAVSSAAGD